VPGPDKTDLKGLTSYILDSGSIKNDHCPSFSANTAADIDFGVYLYAKQSQGSVRSG
jgi:hypothetical protein